MLTLIICIHSLNCCLSYHINGSNSPVYVARFLKADCFNFKLLVLKNKKIKMTETNFLIVFTTANEKDTQDRNKTAMIEEYILMFMIQEIIKAFYFQT